LTVEFAKVPTVLFDSAVFEEEDDTTGLRSTRWRGLGREAGSLDGVARIVFEVVGAAVVVSLGCSWGFRE
jgi:hypothetical protein